MRHIGVTGTRGVLSSAQKAWLKDELVMLDLQIRLVRLERPVLHHGDCVGADKFAHELALGLGWSVVIHPPIAGAHRAYCEIPRDGVSKILKGRKYLDRDRRIAARCSTILGVPGTPWEWSRPGQIISGTWYTLEQAMRLGKEVKICGQ